MARRLVTILFPLTFVFTAISIHAQGFTLEQVMSAPFNSGLTASPKGTRFLWTANEQGRRNLWVAESAGGGFSAHRVTGYVRSLQSQLGDEPLEGVGV